MEIGPLRSDHGAALREFLAEFAASGETEVNGYFGRPEWSHAETVATFDRWSRGDPSRGWVPSTTSFLTHDGRILGVANLRHWLTPHLLQHGGHVGYSVRPAERMRGHATRLLLAAARQARRMGIRQLLVACDADNLASARVIEKCGGVLENEVVTDDEIIRRYWIDLRRGASS